METSSKEGSRVRTLQQGVLDAITGQLPEESVSELEGQISLEEAERTAFSLNHPVT